MYTCIMYNYITCIHVYMAYIYMYLCSFDVFFFAVAALKSFLKHTMTLRFFLFRRASTQELSQAYDHGSTQELPQAYDHGSTQEII